MEGVQVGSMQQATLVVGVLAMATDNDEGLSDNTQVLKHCYSRENKREVFRNKLN